MRTDMGADAIEPSINSLDRGRTGSESCRSSQIETEDTDPEESREEMNGSPTPASSDSKHDARDTQKVVPFEYGEGEEEEGLEDYRHHLHLFDGNYPDFSQSAEFDELEQGEEYEEDSPYPEVRAAVSNMDDPSMPVNTIRMWVLGLFWAIVIAGVNQFFFFRYPNVFIPSIIAQLLSYPMGRILAAVLPDKWGLNPGPFNIKEHALVTVMASVSSGSAYATDIIAVQRFFYGQIWSYGYQILLVISTQMIGFSLAGLLRKFLVWPSSMIWPSTLVYAALFNTLHSVDIGSSQGRWSRDRYFGIVTAIMFAWSWVPNYLFTALSYFDWVTWIAPNNQKINLLFGYQSGAGMSMLTLDWGQVAGIGNPMATPWWATANVLGGFVGFIWVLCPILYYSNAYFFSYLPFSSSSTFDNTGHRYNVTRIINRDASLNTTAYEQYSPLLLSATFSISYGLSFAALSATLVHTALYYRKQIWSQARRTVHDADDIHLKLMSVYPEVPHWWYIGTFLAHMVMGIAAIRVWPTQMPIWAFFLALFISSFLALPIGMIQAITNQQVGLNVITELIVGFVVPGKPVSMMIFKTYGYITMAQGMSFISDMKLGHYMKIPPRLMFTAQSAATFIAAIVQIFVQDWLFHNIDGICNHDQTKTWWCPSTQTFGAASVIWGVIGPARTFGSGAMYRHLNWFWLAGAVVPIPCYLMAKRYPQSGWKYVNWPVIFSGTYLMPPYLPINFISYCYIGYLTMSYARKKHFRWWARYNYITSAAFSCGYSLAIILIFFALQFPNNGELSKGAEALGNWWGNQVYNRVLDAKGVKGAARQLGVGETFGPERGSWH